MAAAAAAVATTQPTMAAMPTPARRRVEGGAHAGGDRAADRVGRGGRTRPPRTSAWSTTPSGPPGRPGPDGDDDDDQGDGQPEGDGQGRPRRAGSGPATASSGRTVPSGPSGESSERDRRARRTSPSEHRQRGRASPTSAVICAARGAERAQAALHLAVAAGLSGHHQPGDRQGGEGGDEREGLQGDHRGPDGLPHGGVEVGALLGDVEVPDALLVELGRQVLVEPLDRRLELAPDRRHAVGAVAAASASSSRTAPSSPRGISRRRTSS